MNIKTTVTALATGALMVSAPFAVFSFAQTSTMNPTRAALRNERITGRMTLRKDRADAEIDRRITAMNNLITRINAMKRLSATQKSALVSQVQAQITALQTLKAKVDADTDPATLKTDKQSIVTSYRIYLLFMPKIRIIANADKILDVADTMKTKTTNADAQMKIMDAQNKAQAAIDAVTPLMPEGYPGNKSILVTARQNLVTAYQDLVSARKLIK